MRAVDANVVAVQEVDRFTRSRPTDRTTTLGRLLGMEIACALAMICPGGEFRIAPLSRLPIVTTGNIALPTLDVDSLSSPT